MSRQDVQVSQRGELEAIKFENETLRRRVRDLELVVKKYRERESAAVEKTAQDIVSDLGMKLGKATVIPKDDAKEDP
ncbi:uncharacterized protein ACLA_069080 [Aspergillus clavatus NRRL 1]|uniref:Uncharacterized protein n=1 Tax=Aspergillus clavatus (strain ATCC 1007 / CBS 513.65 / DSM 816 / NCTC 3887 / NRRL 1 / QM 1276 / 107) TaxID=344612 RepID=A1C659_ASPCL|nr:uncharacterized protein ACLA_069080 [Aspergillus clavatus NRRL 1]EAW13880.1 hypothetical protein ACLA_069080 [Aspergillus clavatus NRRL 1]